MSGKQLIKIIKTSNAFIVNQKMRILEVSGKNQRKQKVLKVVEQFLKNLREKNRWRTSNNEEAPKKELDSMKSENMQKIFLVQMNWKQKILENNKHIRVFFRKDLDKEKGKFD